MFNLEHCKEFYNPYVPANYRKSWYLFVFKFLVCVNGDFLKSLQGSQVKEEKNIFSFISVSDEAFARWALEVKYQEVKLGLGNNEEKKKFKKPPGPHKSIKYSSRYSVIYKEVLDGRTITTNAWNDFFWAFFKYHNPTLFHENSSISAASMVRARNNATPTLDNDRLIQPITKTNHITLNEDEMKEEASDAVVETNHIAYNEDEIKEAAKDAVVV